MYQMWTSADGRLGYIIHPKGLTLKGHKMFTASEVESQMREQHDALNEEIEEAILKQVNIERAHQEYFGEPFKSQTEQIGTSEERASIRKRLIDEEIKLYKSETEQKDNKMTTQEMIQTIKQLQQDAKANAAKIDNLLIRLGQQQK